MKILNTEKENETDIGVHEATRNTIWDYGTRGITKARQFYGLTIEKTLRCCILHKHILHKKSSGDSHHVTVIWCLLLCSVNGNRFYQHIFYTWPITFNKQQHLKNTKQTKELPCGRETHKWPPWPLPTVTLFYNSLSLSMGESCPFIYLIECGKGGGVHVIMCMIYITYSYKACLVRSLSLLALKKQAAMLYTAYKESHRTTCWT